MNNKQLFDLTSPPSAEFDTVQELLWYCNNHAKQNGYAVATKNSKREKNITIKCDFGESKRRQTSSRLDNCPTEIYGKKSVDGIEANSIGLIKNENSLEISLKI